MGERPDRSGLPETTGAGQVCNDRSVSMKQNAADVHRYFSSSFLRFHAGCGFFGSTGARLPRRKPWPSPVPRGGACAPPAARSSARGPPATTATTAHTTLTGAVPELKAEVRAPEPVHGDRQLQQLGPARAVVVVQHEGAVFAGRRLSGAEGDDVLAGEHAGVTSRFFRQQRAVARLSAGSPDGTAPGTTPSDPGCLFLHRLLPPGSGLLILRPVSQGLLCRGWASVTRATWALASRPTRPSSP